MDKRLLALLTALSLSLVALPAFGSDGPTDDHDEDGILDIVEIVLCNSDGIREMVVNPVGGTTGIGQCTDGTDFTPEEEPTPELPSGNDTDEDGIPDVVEPHLCGVEFPSTPHDGSCDQDGQDYTPPDGSAPERNPICDVEDPENETDGSCDDEGNYTPPGGVPVPDPNETLCATEDDNESLDGSCEDGTYQPPGPPGVDPMAILCGVVADHPELGECDDQNNYSPPAPPGTDPHGIICERENPNSDLDGSCEDGTYTPPTPPAPPGLEDVVPAQLNCGGYGTVQELVMAFLTDADCDGDRNDDEISAGCDPLDPESHIDDGCDDPIIPEPPSGPPEHLHCSGFDPVTHPVELVFAILSDADCDGRGNQEDDAPLDPSQ